MARPAAGGAAIDVLFLLLPGALVLDWAGPAEAFRIANQWLARDQAPPRFRLRFVGPRERQPTSVGIEVAGVEPLPTALAPGSWVVLRGPMRLIFFVDLAFAVADAAFVVWVLG